jgi:hypothetical protein
MGKGYGVWVKLEPFKYDQPEYECDYCLRDFKEGYYG